VRDILEADTAAILLLDEATGELVATAAKGLEEEVEQGVRIPLGRGFAGRIAATRTPVVIERVDHRNVMNPILRAKGVRSLVGVPLLARGGMLGVLHVGTLVERHFSELDVELLQLAAERVALALHVRLYDRERMVTETLQRAFLPEALPRVAGLRLGSRYLPASTIAGIGGDWYDVFVLPSGAVALALGDVSGHGLRAASVMGRVRNALRAYAVDRLDPAEVISRLGGLMKYLDVTDIVTLLFGVLEPDLSAFRYVSAGHLPPLIIDRAGRRFAGDGPCDPPLGIGRFHEYNEVVVPLEAGDSMLLYTDGLVERRTEDLSDGLERLRGVASSIWALEPEDAITSLLQAIVIDVEPADDIALLLVQRENASAAVDLRVPAHRDELVTLRRALRRWLANLEVPDGLCNDVLSATGEACANAVEHAYGPSGGWVHVLGVVEDHTIHVTVRDGGRWRGRRSARGQGMTLMRATMDTVEFDRSATGTKVTLKRAWPDDE
jgi:serine phosphatase RsbU (regulator of sigma subunit)